MHELDDTGLLREYVERNSEEAFATLVARHVSKVYSVALRHTGNPHQAEEITQAVFVILARDSRRLCRRVILYSWLYKTARLVSLAFIRGEIRRSRREQEAFMQTILNEKESDAWMQIAPLLDAALAGLNETDRRAIVLRFFYGKSMRETGEDLGANEDAAKKRVNRALEKLRKFFTNRGVNSTPEIIAGAISANSVQTAPSTLANSVTAVALAKGATASTSTLTLIKGALKIMAWTKTKITAAAAVVVILAVGTPIAVHVVHQQREQTTFNLKYANAFDALKLLADLLPGTPANGTAVWKNEGTVIIGKTRLIATHSDHGANSIRVIGPPETREMVRQILEKLDQQPMPGGDATPQLSFGPEVKGLRAALELIPPGKIIHLGDPIEVRFHIRNVSGKNIPVSSGDWRQANDSGITVEDAQGNKVPVRNVIDDGAERLLRILLEPGKTTFFKGGGLVFFAEDADEKDIGKYTLSHPIGYYVKVKPGRYTVRCHLRFDGYDSLAATKSVHPDDWQGELDTAPVTVDVDVAAGSPSAASPDTSTPRKAALVFAKAVEAGDLDAAKKVAIATDAEWKVIQMLGDAMVSIKEFNSAAFEKFGGQDQRKNPPAMSMDSSAWFESADEKIDGDKATLILKGNPHNPYPPVLKKTAAGWVMDLSSMDQDPATPMMVQLLSGMPKALTTVTAELKNGKYKSMEEAISAFNDLMSASHSLPAGPWPGSTPATE